MLSERQFKHSETFIYSWCLNFPQNQFTQMEYKSIKVNVRFKYDFFVSVCKSLGTDNVFVCPNFNNKKKSYGKRNV